MFSGVVTGTIAEKYGWGFVFALLSLFATLTAISSAIYFIVVERKKMKEYSKLEDQEMITIDSVNKITE